MSEPQKFSFGDSSVAIAYDNVLVRVLFEPWAVRLVEEYGPWQDKRVLDLATGTGIVSCTGGISAALSKSLIN